MEQIPRNTFQKQYKEIRTTYIVLKYFFEEKHCDKYCIRSDLCLYWCFVSDLSQFHICNLKEIIVMKLPGFQSCPIWTWTYNNCLHVNSKLAEGRQKEKRKNILDLPDFEERILTLKMKYLLLLVFLLVNITGCQLPDLKAPQGCIIFQYWDMGWRHSLHKTTINCIFSWVSSSD